MNKLELFTRAVKEIGTMEIKAGLVNPKILYYLSNATGKKITENTPWCAAFINSILKDAKIKHSKKLNARSILDLGKAVKVPEVGDLVVFWRSSVEGWQGHAGFYVRELGNVIYVLGGNQGNKVSIAPYPKSQLLGFRDVASGLTKIIKETKKTTKKSK